LENKIIPYGKQNINFEDIEFVTQALKSDYVTQGPLVDKFEEELAKYLNVKHVVVVSNGTAALHIAGLALNLKKGDAVIMPAISFVATSNSVLYCGATPVFADIDIKTGNISLESAEKAYNIAKQNGLNVKAIYPVHFGGMPCNPNEICNFAKKYNLKIVEDACHAIGSKYRKSPTDEFQMAGSFSDMAIWSFHPVKHITTGEGGAVSTNDTELATNLKLLRSHGITKNSNSFENRNLYFDETTNGVNPWYYEMSALGFNYRLPDILCALGISQLKRLDIFVQKRREIANYYREFLKNIDFIELPPIDNEYSYSSYHLFPILIDFKKIKKSRKLVMEELRENGIGSQVHYMPIPWQNYYQSNPDNYLSTDISNSELFYSKELSIPMFFDLNEIDCQKISNVIRKL
jgi:UDP-4-amino-4,6-dideoxy-N-acetyl-beta-L-altrosamine transaminase